MYAVLLSGGSGKRLWPLSNELRAKQYIKIVTDEENTQACSMLQRVWKQLGRSGAAQKSILTASSGQAGLIKSQLGDVDIAIEPQRRDTFPAVVLSCAYIRDKLGAGMDACACFLPADPYTEASYFQTLQTLEGVMDETRADVVLMGVVPGGPSEKYGYIVPQAPAEEPKGGGHTAPRWKVRRFYEKPPREMAVKLIREGALWNCGVFCVRIGSMLRLAESMGAPADYAGLYRNYSLLPKVSFDCQVLEKSQNLYAVPFAGMWKDLGTWDALSEEMAGTAAGGSIYTRGCENTHIINELDIPVAAVGAKDLMIVSSFDGILVTDKAESCHVKDVISNAGLKPRYEERAWGVIKTLDLSETEDGFTLLRKVKIFQGKSSSCHFHNERDEVLTVLSGRGELILDGAVMLLGQGVSLTIPRGKQHALRACCDMEYLETHIGKSVGDEDINRITFDWDDILGTVNHMPQGQITDMEESTG